MKTILSKTCLFLIKIYRVFLSAHFGGACRFYPSCSCYAEKAFLLHPPKKATFLVLKRLSKCYFFRPFGLDPVPLNCAIKKEKRRALLKKPNQKKPNHG